MFAVDFNVAVTTEPTLHITIGIIWLVVAIFISYLLLYSFYMFGRNRGMTIERLYYKRLLEKTEETRRERMIKLGEGEYWLNPQTGQIEFREVKK